MKFLSLFRRVRAPKSRPVSFRPRVEALEDRCLLSIFDWTGAGANSNWNNPANWDILKKTNNNTTPGASDFALFSNNPNPKNPNAVVNVGVEVNGLAVGKGYQGTITINQPLTVDNRLRVNGGTFDGPADLTLGNDAKNMDGTGSIGGTAIFKGAGATSRFRVVGGSTLTISKATVTFDKRPLLFFGKSELAISNSTINLNNSNLVDSSTVLKLDQTVTFNSTGGGGLHALKGMTLAKGAVATVNVPVILADKVDLTEAGTSLTLTAGGTIASPFILSNTSKLVFGAGAGKTPATYTWKEGTQITGKTQNGNFPGSQVVITGNITTAGPTVRVKISTVKLDLTNATLTGQIIKNGRRSSISLDKLTVTQASDVTLNALNIVDRGAINITGAPGVGMRLTNASHFNFSGTTVLENGVIGLLDNSTIENWGTFTLQGSISGVLGTPGTKFTNEGTKQKAFGTLIKTGTQVSPFSKGILENLGLIRIDQGLLKAPGLVQKDKGETKENGGNIQVNDPMDLEGGILDNVGDSAQNGQVIGDVVNSGGDVEPGGPVAPGNTGILTITGNYTQQKNGTLTIVLDGLYPGTGYDQLVVNGKVTLAGKLDIVAPPGFVAGASYTIINNEASGKFVQGTFTGLPEGAKIMLAGQQYFITYVGGPTFNDVILQPAQVTLNKLSDNITGVITYNDGQGHSGSEDVYIAQFNVTLTTGPNRSVTFNTFCIDLFHNVTVDQTYAVNARNDVAQAFVNGSRMEYIYQQFGEQDLTDDPDQAAAVQLAEWDLLLNNHDPQSFSLDPGTTSVYSSGDPNVFSVDLGSNADAAKIAALVDSYLKASIGATTQGAWLDASASGDAVNRGQSLLVPESALNQIVPRALLPPSSPNAGPNNGPALDTFFAVYSQLSKNSLGQ